MMRKIITIFSLIIFVKTRYVFSQNDSALINSLIKDIAASQASYDGEFHAGSFPSFRKCGGAPHNYQPDNNIFFTAVTAFTFKNLQPFLNSENKKISEKIIENAATAFPPYRDQFGDPFYNFWPAHDAILPHSYYFKYLNSVFGQGEDADDSVMILMACDNNDSDNVTLKKRLIEVSNLSHKKIISTFKKYRSFAAYSTYLGERMTPDFDFCVHCNILYFMLSKQLPLVKQDSATIQLVAQMVRNRDYMRFPVYLSPYYVKSPILIYHVTRLMGAFHIPELEPYKSQLIKDAESLLQKSTNIMDQIILRTSLLRLGEKVSPLNIGSLKDFEASNQQQYIFFQARAAFSYPTPLKQIFLHWSYITYYFYCPSYNKTLLLEYLVTLKNSAKRKLRQQDQYLQ